MAYPDSVFMQFGQFLIDCFSENIQNPVNLVFGAVPVRGGKGLQGNIFNAVLSHSFKQGKYILRAGTVSGLSGEISFLCPSAVTVHDYGNMFGQRRNIFYHR